MLWIASATAIRSALYGRHSPKIAETFKKRIELARSVRRDAQPLWGAL